MPRLWVISELYYPEETSTGYIVTRLAEGLAQRLEDWEVHAIAAQPTYSMRAVLAPAYEQRNGVAIHRIRSTTLDKDVLIKRTLNMVTVSVGLALKALVSVRRGDVLLVVTNPPVMPLLMQLIVKYRRALLVLLVHDLYPDLPIASGALKATGMTARIWQASTTRLLRACDRIVTLSSDMAELICNRSGRSRADVAVVPNWADVESVAPRRVEDCVLTQRLGLEDKFIIQYAGNIGNPHAIEDVLGAAEILRTDSRIHFLFIGDGARRAELEEGVKRRSLPNFTIMDAQPRSTGQEYLPVSHVGLLLLRPGMLGVSSPSRFYNILATGRPVIAVIDQRSEVAKIIQRERIGWTVAPGDSEALVLAIIEASVKPEECSEAGRRARSLAEAHYSFDSVLDSYVELINSIKIVGSVPQ